MSDIKRPDIQTLRAVAVLSVVAFHAFPDAIPGGFIGVDVFFVLSGYLITQSILNGLHRGDFTVADFYRRRVRRIFPALFVMLAAVGLAGWFILDPDQFLKLGRTIVSASVFASNFEFALTTGYFDGGAVTKPLLHTWSLAVEEQFYIFHPLMLVFVYRFRPKWLLPSIIVLAALSLALSEVMLSRWSSSAYYLAPPRFYELLIGAALAAWGGTIKAGSVGGSALFVAGLAAILVPVFTYSEATRFPGLSALIPCFGTALIIAVGPSLMGVSRRLLSLGPVVAIGDWSYSLYLWHWPVLVYLALAWPTEAPIPVIGVALLATLVISWLSYRFIEQPIAAVSLRQAPFLRYGLAAIVLASAVGGSLFVLKGVPGRFDSVAAEQLLAADDINPLRTTCHSGEGRVLSYDEGCVFGTAGAYPDTIVWGDSHGAELSVALGKKAEQHQRSVRELTYSACPPTLHVQFANRPQCDEYNEQLLADAIADTKLQTVVLVANFAAYGKDEAVVAGFSEVASQLAAAAKDVVIVLPIPTMPFAPPGRVAAAIRYGETTNDLGRTYDSYIGENGAIRQALTALAPQIGATIIDPAEQLCQDGICRAFDPSYGTLFFDNMHLGVTGAGKVISAFEVPQWVD